MLEKYLMQLFTDIAEIITIKGEHKFTAFEIVNACDSKHAGMEGFYVADSHNGKLFYEMLRNFPTFEDNVRECIKTKKQFIFSDDNSYCITPLICKGEVPGIITVGFGCSAAPFGEQEKKLLLELSRDVVCGALELQKYQDLSNTKDFKHKFNTIVFDTYCAISITYEKYDNFRSGHQARVAALSSAIAKKLKLNQKDTAEILLGAAIHDIGKLYIRSSILNRPGKLITEEYQIIKKHPEFGIELVKNIKFNSKIPKNIILQHHERYDGSGYPYGLKGKEIPIESLIVAVADVVEAMTALRSYHPAYSIEEALNEIKRNKNILFDPEVVDICIELFEKDGFNFPRAGEN